MTLTYFCQFEYALRWIEETFLKPKLNLKRKKRNALEYENKEQKEIKEKKSEGDDNDWGNETNCNSFARI